VSGFTRTNRVYMMERLTELQSRVIFHTMKEFDTQHQANLAFGEARELIDFVVDNLTKRQAKMVFPAIMHVCTGRNLRELQQATNPRRVPSLSKHMREKIKRASAIITVAAMLDPVK
jgi:metallophosphoesterase superfamily enzyme